MTKNFSTNACYAALKAGFNEENSDYAFLRIVLGLIQIRRYHSFDVQNICKDFKKEFCFDIPYFPMQRVLCLASEKNFTRCNGGKYYPDLDKIDKEKFVESLSQKQKEYEEIISAFVSFTKKKHKVEYSRSVASNIIDSFVEEKGISFIQDRKMFFSSPQQNYIFSEFLLEIETSDPRLFDCIDSIIVGRILSEYVNYHEKTNESNFSKTVAYIDTGFAFRLLGIDNLDRQAIYSTLVSDMKNIGIQVKMFHHSYTEMIGIISNSSLWIDNLNYDPSKASESAYYFVTNGFSREKINEICLSAKSNLMDYGVTIEEIDYPQTLPIGVQHETDIYERIVDYYTQTNPLFVEKDKKYTVEQDARSFFYLQYLCKGIFPNQISDIKYIFVTTNKSLPIISHKIISEKIGTTNTFIPFCVTDIFWGTVIWAKTPAKLIESSKSRLAAELYSAFTPSEDMLRKLTASLAECEAKGTLSADECYMLKASKVASHALMELTLGNSEAFEEKTPLMILHKIQSDAKAEGAEEERTFAHIQLHEKETEIYEEKIKRVDSSIHEFQRSIEQQKMQIGLLKETQKSYNDSIERLIKQKEQAEQKTTRETKELYIGIILAIIAYVAFGYVLWSVQQEKDYLGLFQFLLSVLVYGVFGIWAKSMNPIDWIKIFSTNKKKKNYKYFGYDSDEHEHIIDKILKIQHQEEQTSSELTSLEERLNAFLRERATLTDSLIDSAEEKECGY